MIIDQLVRRAVDVLIAIQESVRETQINRAGFVESFPLICIHNKKLKSIKYLVFSSKILPKSTLTVVRYKIEFT